MLDGEQVNAISFPPLPRKPVILALTPHFLPGFKAGGPIKSLVNLARALKGEFNFRVVTLDRDFGDREPYPGVELCWWKTVGAAEVMYLSPSHFSIGSFASLLGPLRYDVLYINSFFSFNFSIKPLMMRRLGLLQKVPVVLAPRGEVSPGALGIKSVKKKIYLAVGRALQLYDGVVWQATSPQEEDHIRRWFGKGCHLVVAPNVPSAWGESIEPPLQEKSTGHLRLVFLSRVSPKKNLKLALHVLTQVKGDIEFDIYGPLEDPAYWQECLKVIQDLPSNVRVQYRGSVHPDSVHRVFADYHVFFFPTLGENFGHVILEALSSGCPVLLSDQTPWRNLESLFAGWDLCLHHPERFGTILQQCVNMNTETYRMWSEGARRYALQYMKDDKLTGDNIALFRFAVSVGENYGTQRDINKG